MFTNDGDVIRRDKFFNFYRLRKSKDPSYYEFKSWDRASRLILDYPSSLRNWKPIYIYIYIYFFFFFSLEVIGNSSLVRT